MKFKHIGIKVQNLEKSREFYTQVLGCTLYYEKYKGDTTLVFYKAHGAVIELIHNPNNKAREIGPIDHIAFTVKSVDEKVAELSALGIELDFPPRLSGNVKIAFFRGPNGERIEYAEELES